MRTAINQDENVKRSERTKLALAQLKAKGVILGSTTGFTDAMRKKAVEANKKLAAESLENRRALHILCGERKSGKTFERIATLLNHLGFKTRRGNEYKKQAVFALHQRCKKV